MNDRRVQRRRVVGVFLLAGALAGACSLSRSGSLEQTCSSVVDCDDGTPCTEDVCNAGGLCEHQPVDGTALIEQAPYDCKRLFCENGRERSAPDDADLPSAACIDYTCHEGELFESNRPNGTLCTEGQGSGTCSGGKCIIVCDPGDPSWMETCDDHNDCTIDGCDAISKSCVRQSLDNQESTTPDPPGNCRINICVGGQEIEDEIDNTDLPDDGELCTDDECLNGNPTFIPVAVDTPCPTGFCSTAGDCVQCNDATQCAGQDTFCQVRTCNNNSCGFSNTADNTPLPPQDQTAGPCKEVQCDGQGGTKIVDRPNGTSCNDGTFCNGTDTCLAGACTVHAGNPCPGPDGDGDCSESCNESSDSCTLADPNGTACDDLSFCNGTDSCGGGTCSVHTGNPCPGADGDGDCAESCSEANDNCLAPDPNGSACTDGLFCNGPDACSGGSCSIHPGNPCPGADGDGDCTESCDETNDNCDGADANGSACTDGDFCNGTEICGAGSCGSSSGNPCSGHNVGPACNDSCNESNDSCTAPDSGGTLCNDGSFCTTVDTCNGSGSCLGTGNPCPGHDVGPSCNDSCDETADNCSGNDLMGTSCNDGLFCTVTDTCDGTGSCQGTGNPCPGQDVGPSCDDSCNETVDDCSASDLDATPCDDGFFCNGSEACAAGACTGSSGNPCPGQDVGPSCSDSCDEDANNCFGDDADGTSCGQVQICATGMCVSGCGVDLEPIGGTSCPPGCDSCDLANGICFIDCDAANECQNVTLACPADWECVVTCSGNAACDTAVISCPVLYACDVACSASGACAGLTIDCPVEGTCNLTCTTGNNATCANATLDCSSSLNDCTAACAVGGPVTANCNGASSCACSGCP